MKTIKELENYLNKKTGKVYVYTGDFQNALTGKKVLVRCFHPGGDEKNTCEAFIEEIGKETNCEWIPKKEIINNLKDFTIIKNNTKIINFWTAAGKLDS